MKSNNEWKKLLLERLLQFAVRIIKLANKLPRTSAGFVISNQLIRAGTSIGANIEEAQDASSSRDFVQKMGIALREAKETRYWLKIIEIAELLPKDDVNKELLECGEIVAILVSSVKAAKLRIK